jgi:hypothetical protein
VLDVILTLEMFPTVKIQKRGVGYVNICHGHTYQCPLAYMTDSTKWV